MKPIEEFAEAFDPDELEGPMERAQEVVEMEVVERYGFYEEAPEELRNRVTSLGIRLAIVELL